MDPVDDFTRDPMRHSFSLGDAILGRRLSTHVTVDVPAPPTSFSLSELSAEPVILDDGRRVGLVTGYSVDLQEAKIRLNIMLNDDIALDELTGRTLLVALRDVVVVDREPLRIPAEALERSASSWP